MHNYKSTRARHTHTHTLTMKVFSNKIPFIEGSSARLLLTSYILLKGYVQYTYINNLIYFPYVYTFHSADSVYQWIYLKIDEMTPIEPNPLIACSIYLLWLIS